MTNTAVVPGIAVDTLTREEVDHLIEAIPSKWRRPYLERHRYWVVPRVYELGRLAGLDTIRSADLVSQVFRECPYAVGRVKEEDAAGQLAQANAFLLSAAMEITEEHLSRLGRCPSLPPFFLVRRFVKMLADTGFRASRDCYRAAMSLAGILRGHTTTEVDALYSLLCNQFKDPSVWRRARAEVIAEIEERFEVARADRDHVRDPIRFVASPRQSDAIDARAAMRYLVPWLPEQSCHDKPLAALTLRDRLHMLICESCFARLLAEANIERRDFQVPDIRLQAAGGNGADEDGSHSGGGDRGFLLEIGTKSIRLAEAESRRKARIRLSGDEPLTVRAWRDGCRELNTVIPGGLLPCALEYRSAGYRIHLNVSLGEGDAVDIAANLFPQDPADQSVWLGWLGWLESIREAFRFPKLITAGATAALALLVALFLRPPGPEQELMARVEAGLSAFESQSVERGHTRSGPGMLGPFNFTAAESLDEIRIHATPKLFLPGMKLELRSEDEERLGTATVLAGGNGLTAVYRGVVPRPVMGTVRISREDWIHQRRELMDVDRQQLRARVRALVREQKTEQARDAVTAFLERYAGQTGQ